jgi:hypothetical protein
VRLYVGFRSSQPDEEIVEEVLEKLKEYNIDVSQLVDWPANHCQSAQSSEEEEEEKEEEEEEEEDDDDESSDE